MSGSFNGSYMTASKDAGKLRQKLFHAEPVMTGTLPHYNSENLFKPEKESKISEMRYYKALGDLSQGTSSESEKKLDGVPTAPLEGSEELSKKLEKVNLEPEIILSDDEDDETYDAFENRYDVFSPDDWRYNVSTLKQVLNSASLRSNETKYVVLQKKIEDVSLYFKYVRNLDNKK